MIILFIIKSGWFTKDKDNTDLLYKKTSALHFSLHNFAIFVLQTELYSIVTYYCSLSSPLKTPTILLTDRAIGGLVRYGAGLPIYW